MRCASTRRSASPIRCRPARPYFAAFDETTHDFVLVIEDLGRLRIADQIVGCTATDAETVIDAVAGHHAYWWEGNSGRLASLPWLKTFSHTTVSRRFWLSNFEAAWPRVIEGIGADLSPEMRGLRRTVHVDAAVVHAIKLARPPRTFLHGDLRLDQLFFAVDGDDPPVTALDWQITMRGRGAYDLGYFLSQSLTTDTRRGCEAQPDRAVCNAPCRTRDRLSRKRIAAGLSPDHSRYASPIQSWDLVGSRLRTTASWSCFAPCSKAL